MFSRKHDLNRLKLWFKLPMAETCQPCDNSWQKLKTINHQSHVVTTAFFFLVNQNNLHAPPATATITVLLLASNMVTPQSNPKINPDNLSHAHTTTLKVDHFPSLCMSAGGSPKNPNKKFKYCWEQYFVQAGCSSRCPANSTKTPKIVVLCLQHLQPVPVHTPPIGMYTRALRWSGGWK